MSADAAEPTAAAELAHPRDFRPKSDLQRRIDAALVAAAYLRDLGYAAPELRDSLSQAVCDGVATMSELLGLRGPTHGDGRPPPRSGPSCPGLDDTAAGDGDRAPATPRVERRLERRDSVRPKIRPYRSER